MTGTFFLPIQVGFVSGLYLLHLFAPFPRETCRSPWLAGRLNNGCSSGIQVRFEARKQITTLVSLMLNIVSLPLKALGWHSFESQLLEACIF